MYHCDNCRFLAGGPALPYSLPWCIAAICCLPPSELPPANLPLYQGGQWFCVRPSESERKMLLAIFPSLHPPPFFCSAPASTRSLSDALNPLRCCGHVSGRTPEQQGAGHLLVRDIQPKPNTTLRTALSWTGLSQHAAEPHARPSRIPHDHGRP